MKVLTLLLGVLFGGQAYAQEKTLLPPDVHIIRVWDCSANWVSKGWAIDEADCIPVRRSGTTARKVLDQHLKSSAEFSGYEVYGVEIKQEVRGGVFRKKVWTVYHFQLRPPAKTAKSPK